MGTGGNGGQGGVAGAGSFGGHGGAAGAGGATLDCDGFLIPEDQPATASYELGTDSVTDRTTGLMWQRTPEMFDYLNFARCPAERTGPPSDWRRPTVLELITIVDYGAYAPTINTLLFPTPATSEWINYGTSTPVGANSPLNSWSVSFKLGQTVNGSSSSGHLRCVRRAVEKICFTPPRFWVNDKASASNGAPTVVDKKTTLAWQRDFAPEPLSWEDAKQYCTAFGRAAHLPTAKEGVSIVDWEAPTAIDAATFPNTPTGHYWTATTVPGDSTAAFTIRFGDPKHAYMLAAPKVEKNIVRCILNP